MYCQWQAAINDEECHLSSRYKVPTLIRRHNFVTFAISLLHIWLKSATIKLKKQIVVSNRVRNKFMHIIMCFNKIICNKKRRKLRTVMQNKFAHIPESGCQTKCVWNCLYFYRVSKYTQPKCVNSSFWSLKVQLNYGVWGSIADPCEMCVSSEWEYCVMSNSLILI